MAVPAESLRKGDVFVVVAGEMIPADGEIVEGAATVDESAITGESAPVIREAGGTGARSPAAPGCSPTRLWCEVTANPGESFMDRMIALIEGASRQKTPNEIALTILLAALTIIFLVVIITLKPFGAYAQVNFSVPVLVALLVCLIPTTIGGLLSAIGIAGIDRLVQKNVLAMSGRAVEAAGDVDVLLLDKTGTITLGNRQAVEFIPAPGTDVGNWPTRPNWPPWPTRPRKGAASWCWPRSTACAAGNCTSPQRPVCALHRQDQDERGGPGRGAATAKAPQTRCGISWANPWSRRWMPRFSASARMGGTPLVVGSSDKIYGVIYLKDIVKGGPAGPLRALAGHGHHHGDDHRRQPPHRRGHRRGGRGGRFSGRGQARGQAGPDPPAAGGRAPGGHDRRRHQRRPGPGPGRRGRGHEHRHPGGQGGRQHGGPGQQPHQAHRDRGDRQADCS